MTLQLWIDKHNGKPVDFDGNKKYWCVDLMRNYLVEVLGMNGWYFPAAKNAKTIFLNFKSDKKFTKIWNTQNNFPVKGDIFFFGNRWNPFDNGHVCIISGATVKNFISLDQNWPIGSLVHYQNHNYNNALGWFHPTGVK
jgi:hypothetical protein